MANNDKNDKELSDYLEGNSDLSKAYAASKKAEPAAYLDEKILSAAKESVAGVKYREKRRFHKSPWTLPVSVAAMITLSVSLVVTMQQETGQPLISEPKVEMYDADVKIEAVSLPETIESFDGTVKNNDELKQKKDERIPAPATSDAAADMYHAEEQLESAKMRERVVPAKKPLLKEGARTESYEAREFADDKVKTMRADIGFSENEMALLESEKQNMDLKAIKLLWENGEFDAAKKMYMEFIEQYPDFNLEEIKDKLGTDLYQSLQE